MNTRVACLRAVRTVFAWVEAKGLRLDQIRPVHVAASVELLTGPVPGPLVTQNPAAAVRGPSESAEKGKTPALDADEARQLLDATETTGVVGQRDRAVIGLMVPTSARDGAPVGTSAEHTHPQGHCR